MEKNAKVMFVDKGVVEIQEGEIPVPQSGELLIRTSKSLISTGTELSMLEGAWTMYEYSWAAFPCTPGYSNVGHVVAVGDGVEASWIGKRVATYGGHSKFVTMDQSGARIVQSDISDELATFFTISEIVMNGIRRSNVQWGESAAVYGMGLLGQLAARYLEWIGVSPVFGADISDFRLEMLAGIPGITSINTKKDDIVEIAREKTRGRMMDVVFELTGVAALIPDEFKILRNQGRFILLSSPRGGKTEFDFHSLCNGPSYTIIGAHNNSHPVCESGSNQWTKERHAELFFDLVSKGILNIENLISHRGHYTEAPEFYNLLMKDRSVTMGVILDWE